MAKTKSEISKAQPQDTVQSEQQELQQAVPSENRIIQRLEPRYPRWPTSKPGPQSILPVPGTRPVNTFRSEQVVEIDYNQETGESSVDSPQRSMPDASIHGLISSFNQSSSTQSALGKRKERL